MDVIDDCVYRNVCVITLSLANTGRRGSGDPTEIDIKLPLTLAKFGDRKCDKIAHNFSIRYSLFLTFLKFGKVSTHFCLLLF